MKINKLYLLFMIVISLLFFIEGEIVFNLAFYCTIFCTVIGIISLIILYFGVNIKIDFDKKHYNTCDNYDFNLKLINKLYFFVPFVGIYYISGDKLINKITNVNIHETKIIKSEIMFKYRGIYEFKDFRLEIKDIMFIFTKYKYLKSDSSIKVYPKIRGISEEGRAKLNYIFHQSISRALIENDNLNVKDIRKYNYNDSYKRIHWKATSKTGQLYVKNYESIDNSTIEIFLDMNEDIIKYGKDIEEKYVEYALSILNYIVDKHGKFQIHFVNNVEEVIFLNERSGFHKAIEYLTDNKCIGKQDLFDNVLKATKDMPKGEFIIIITFKMDESIRDKVIKLTSGKAKCVVLYFEDNLDEKYLNTLEVQCFSMSKLIM